MMQASGLMLDVKGGLRLSPADKAAGYKMLDAVELLMPRFIARFIKRFKLR